MAFSPVVVGGYPISQGTLAANANYALAFTPAVLTITPATPTVTITGAPSPSVQGQTANFTVTVNGVGVGGGGAVPTGGIGLSTMGIGGGSDLGSATLVSGQVVISASALPVGTTQVTANFTSGDANYTAANKTTMQTVQALSVTALNVVAATGAGSGNSGAATMPTLAPGASLPLITTATYNNGTTSALNGSGGLTYASSDAAKVNVDATGKITGIAAGNATITVTAPNGVTTIIVTVGSGSGGGLMNPNPQPAAHAAAVTAVSPTGAALPVAQPGRR